MNNIIQELREFFSAQYGNPPLNTDLVSALRTGFSLEQWLRVNRTELEKWLRFFPLETWPECTFKALWEISPQMVLLYACSGVRPAFPGNGAYLYNLYLNHAKLANASFCGADLRRASLNGADLRYANLSGANLKQVFLHGADLRYANLSGADCRDAYFGGANLYGANLYRAIFGTGDLNNAIISQDQLDSTRVDS